MWPQDQAGQQQLRGADRLELAAGVTAPASARQFVREACRRWLVPGEQAGTAELLASELVTNSVQASGVLAADSRHRAARRHAIPIGIRLVLFDASLVLEVRDTSPEPPVLLDPAHDAEHGRGLQLVDSLCERWGYYYPGCYASPDGKAVWCELALAA